MTDQRKDTDTGRNKSTNKQVRPWDDVARLLAILLKLVLWAAVIVLIMLACVWLQDLLVPLLLAGIVAYMFNPLVEWIEEKGAHRGFGIVLAITIVIVVLAVVITLAAITSTGDAKLVSDGVKSFRGHLSQSRPSAEFLARIEDLFRSNISQFAASSAELGGLIGGKLWNAITGLGHSGIMLVSAVAKSLLFAIVAFYLLKDFATFKRSAIRLVPPASRNRIVVVLGRIDEHLRGFFHGQLLVCLALVLIYAVGLLICGVPFALVIAFAAGLANIVPYLGLVVGVLPAVVLSFIAYGTLWHPLGAIIVFAIGQAIEGTVLTPRIVGRSANLHPVVVIIAILLFSKILGFVGLLLAVPIAAVVKVLVGEALQTYKRSTAYQSGSRHRSSKRRSGRRRRPNQSNRENQRNTPDRSGKSKSNNTQQKKNGQHNKPD